MFAGCLFFGLGMRVGIVPAYMPQNGCTGCTLFWEDIPILAACLAFLAVLQVLVIIRTNGITDPLMYRRDLKISTAITLFAWISYILAVVDPGDLMKQQRVDWFLFESLTALFLHLHRCVLQVYRVSRLHRLGEQHLRLIDLLQDQRAAIMFEKYLMGELASENLLFWREAIKYKLNFDRNKDFDYSQQVAKVLFRTFVAKHAQLPM
jgi:hypothetical protein